MWEAGVSAQLASPSDHLPQPEAGVQVRMWQLELQRIVLGSPGAHIRAGTFPSRVHIPETGCSPGASSGEGVAAAGRMGVLKVVRLPGLPWPEYSMATRSPGLCWHLLRGLHGQVQSPGVGWGVVRCVHGVKTLPQPGAGFTFTLWTSLIIRIVP